MDGKYLYYFRSECFFNRPFSNSNLMASIKNSESYFENNFCPIKEGMTWTVKILK